MMVYSNRQVADNLRKQVQKLKAKLETIKTFLKETMADETWADWQDREYAEEALKILEAE